MNSQQGRLRMTDPWGGVIDSGWAPPFICSFSSEGVSTECRSPRYQGILPWSLFILLCLKYSSYTCLHDYIPCLTSIKSIFIHKNQPSLIVHDGNWVNLYHSKAISQGLGLFFFFFPPWVFFSILYNLHLMFVCCFESVWIPISFICLFLLFLNYACMLVW